MGFVVCSELCASAEALLTMVEPLRSCGQGGLQETWGTSQPKPQVPCFANPMAVHLLFGSPCRENSSHTMAPLYLSFSCSPAPSFHLGIEEFEPWASVFWTATSGLHGNTSVLAQFVLVYSDYKLAWFLFLLIVFSILWACICLSCCVSRMGFSMCVWLWWSLHQQSPGAVCPASWGTQFETTTSAFPCFFMIREPQLLPDIFFFLLIWKGACVYSLIRVCAPLLLIESTDD